MENLELKILEELNKLERFNLKNPVDSKNFWKEWQSVYTNVKLSQIAIRSLVDRGDLDRAELKELTRKLKTFKEVEQFLKELKEVALQVKGYSIFTPEEENEEGDFDDFLF